MDENGKEVKGVGEGYLVFNKPWPGMMRTLFGNHERYQSVYFSKFSGYYCTGDGKLIKKKKSVHRIIYEFDRSKKR